MSHLFQFKLLLILKNTSKLITNTVSKSSIIAKFFLKKTLKFNPRHWFFSLKTIFVLMPLLNNCFAGKKNDRKDLLGFICTNSLEIIFILLAKAVAFQI